MAAFPKLNSPIQPIPRQLVRCQSCIASVAMVISTPEERLRRQGSFGAVDHHFARPDGAANTITLVTIGFTLIYLWDRTLAREVFRSDEVSSSTISWCKHAQLRPCKIRRVKNPSLLI
jgi:hypothetical protein